MLKKWKIILVVTFLVLSTAGFAFASTDDVKAWLEEVRVKHEGTTVTIAAAVHPSTTAMKQVALEFEQATGVNIVWDEMEEGLVITKALLENQAGTGRYDIIMNCVEYNPFFIEAGAIEDLRPYLNNEKNIETPAWHDFEDIMYGARDMFYYEGDIYGVPFAGTLMFLIYNKDIFAKYDKTPPQTWEEFAQLAKFFKEQGLYGAAFRAQRGWQFTMIWSAFMSPFGGGMIDPDTGRPVMDSPGNIEALKYMISLKDFAPLGIENMNYPEVWDALMAGNTAMAIESSSAPSMLENKSVSPVAGKMGYTAMPAGPRGAYSGVWGWGYSISSQSKNKDAAWATIVWLTSKLNQDKYLDAGGIVTRESALTDPKYIAKYPHFEALYKTYQQAGDLAKTGWEIVPKMLEFAEITEILGLQGSRGFIGEISAEEACEIAQKESLKVLGFK